MNHEYPEGKEKKEKKKKKDKKDKKNKKDKKKKKKEKKERKEKGPAEKRKRTREEYDAGQDPIAQMYSSVSSWSAAKEVSLAPLGGAAAGAAAVGPAAKRKPSTIELTIDDRLGKKVRVKCAANDTVGELKLAIAAETGTRPEKIKLVRAQAVLKDGIRLDDYEIHSGSGIEMYYS